MAEKESGINKEPNIVASISFDHDNMMMEFRYNNKETKYKEVILKAPGDDYLQTIHYSDERIPPEPLTKEEAEKKIFQLLKQGVDQLDIRRDTLKETNHLLKSYSGDELDKAIKRIETFIQKGDKIKRQNIIKGEIEDETPVSDITMESMKPASLHDLIKDLNEKGHHRN